MKLLKGLPCAAVILCVPGIALRALHLSNGFDSVTGLPVAGSHWMWYCVALFAACAVLYAVLALPQRARRQQPFELLLGTKHAVFRMAAVAAGLLLMLGGALYLYLAVTVIEEDSAGWARILEIAYAAVTIITGICAISLAAAQASTVTEGTAKLTLVPLLWSCMHLLVAYRMTCVDPKLPSFMFGLIADVMLVLAFYHLARLLYGKPRPEKLAFFGALTVTMALSDLGGYGLSRLMGACAVSWPAKMAVRSGLSVAACLLVLAELGVLAAGRSEGYPIEYR